MKSTPTAIPARTRRRALAALLLTGLPVALLAAVGSAAPAQAATHTVVIKQYAYTPATLTIGQGDTVTWTNQDAVQHDVMVTSGPATFHSPMLAKGQSWSFTFGTAGSYSYTCSVHPDMKASVTVKPAATQPAGPAQPQGHDASHAAVPTQATPPATTRPRTGRSHQAAAAPKPAPASPAVAAPAATTELSAPATSAATLDPLLIVAGVSAAVMVFCLLLMTSRPVVQPQTQAETLPAPPESGSTAPD